MSGYVTILVLWLFMGDGGGIAIHEFADRNACEKVGVAFVEKHGAHKASWVCVAVEK